MRYRRLVAKMSRALIPTALCWLAGCGGEGAASTGDTTGTTTTATFDYPMDDVLRLNHLQAKGTHNSYHIAAEDTILTPLDYTHAPLDVQLASQGVRQIELDVRYDKFQDHFTVFHETFDKGTTCPTLVECLSLVKAWSDKNPAHHPVFIQLETKDGTTAEKAEAFFASLESEVLSVFPRERVLAPDDVRGEAASVLEAITAKGWPTLGEVRGKVVFFIDDSSDLRTFYTHGSKDLNGRLMFIDSEPTDPWAGVLLANDPTAEAALIEASVSAGLIVRTRADADNVEPLAGDTSTRDKAFASGAQLVSTDYPAPVDGVDYVVEVPDGTPSRCNPKTAPAGCTSRAIEDPAFVDP
jgi:hypothetical protein